MPTATNIIAVPDHKGRAGLITWWTLSGTVDYHALEERWLAEGREPAGLPALPSDTAALRRAIETYKDSRVLVRTLPGSVYAVVDELVEDDEDDPEYEVRFRAWLDDDGTVRFDRTDRHDRDKILARFQEARNELTHHEVSPWLTAHASRLNAVGLRSSGGVYFIPEARVESWASLVTIVEEVSENVICLVPAMRSERAVQAIMDAVLNDTSQQVDKIVQEMEEGTLGKRALATRTAIIADLGKRLEVYEQMFSVRMDSVRTLLESVDARVAHTAMILDAEADAA